MKESCSYYITQKKNRNIDKNISVFEESNVFSKMKKFRDEKD